MSEFLDLINKEGTFEYYFKMISQIPRGSHNNKAISDYLVEFAKEHGLKYVQDDALNVIIFKDASLGYENCDTVMLQGHMDMVCEKTASSNHNFETDGLKLCNDDKYIFAEDTTLGGDDGIAIAYALAILADNSLKHPALEVVITTDEEVGMDGARGLDSQILNSKYILNLDSEEEGVFLVSCAGGIDVTTKIKTSFSEAKGRLMTIVVDGLKGGHSGTEIDKNRVNANLLLGRILNELKKKYFRINLASVDGGNKNNAIPRMSQARLIVDDRMEGIEEYLQIISETIRNEKKYCEAELQITWQFDDRDWEKVFSTDCEKNIIRYLMISPNGIIEMSAAMNNLVETSLNLGIMKTTDEYVEFSYLVRSSVESGKMSVYDRISVAADCCGGKCSFEGDYPGWEYEADSKLRRLTLDVYKEVENKEAMAIAIHAGLECGIIKEKLPKADIISYGPDILDIHTTEERMDMESAIRVYDFTIKLLEAMSRI